MAIVLAIEPDRRQAAQLTAIVRQLVDAELVIADTTEGALDAIGNRVPDLVLVPALLSPQDDAALAAALRVIAAAAHVRTLTIPVLANGVKRAPAGGMLAKWRKHRAASPEPDGCDPSVFGEQIAAYLQEAAAERAELADDELLHDDPIGAAAPMRIVEPAAAEPEPAPSAYVATEPVPAPIEHSWTVASEPQTPITEWVEEPAVQAGYQPTAETTLYAIDEPMAEPPLHASDEAIAEAAVPVSDEPIDETVIAASDDPLIDLSGELEELSEEADQETFDGEPVGVYTLSVDVDESPAADTSVFDTFDLAPGFLEPTSITEEVEAALDQIAASAEVQGEPVRIERQAARRRPVDVVRAEPRTAKAPAVEPDAPRADIAPWVPMYLTPGRMWPALEGVPAETPVARTEQPDWIELVASLRQDLERRRTDQSPVIDPIVARPSDGADANSHRLVKKPRPAPRVHVRKAKPVQDEWGFFDPERCGFSTLLAKLEEITEEDVRT